MFPTIFVNLTSVTCGFFPCVWSSVVVITVLPFQPKYQLGHPKNYLFSLPTKIFSGSKYPKTTSFNFENRSAGPGQSLMIQNSCHPDLLSSGSFQAEKSFRSPRKIINFHYIKKNFSGSKYQKNKLFDFDNRSIAAFVRSFL